VLRRGLLWLSERQRVFDFVRRNRLARGVARRFVAGETVEEGVGVACEVVATGIAVTLDLLGESVADAPTARSACEGYLELLNRMANAGIAVNVSLKLTQMGLDIGEDLCDENMTRILDRASEVDGFVRLDMEGSDYTQRTLDFFAHRLHPRYGNRVGVVIQSALRRSAEDVDRLIRLGARVRLCKGAYLEPPSIAFPDKRDVDQNFVTLMERLLLEGTYPAIATHDATIINRARALAGQHGLAEDRFEFQMLYGVRRDLQTSLRSEGYRMRVYIPFGTQWYPYLMRRLAERPGNLVFMAGNIIREGLSRS